jgi:hypothetical protein
MKKHFIFLVSTFVLALFFFASCDKDDNTTTTPKTKTELLTQSNWKFKSAFVGTTDISTSLQACQKDNILTFSASGNGNLDEGAAKCNTGDPQNNLFTWNFQTNETKIFISTILFTNGDKTFDLISLTETELVVSQPFIPPVGPTQIVVVTFQH